ncbi:MULTISPECIES: urate hydroxylase PuuD [unclassified Modicisalibacter]|uniref:urate hydroxylase PuuD n=1 Tax=unclassified Modicisalibacter TaxID=2679913 RepID=UPI001CC98554|nr:MULTISPECIES: urate hydroxylase PuuD [unclassified Modicisalibacter]MBZ9558735.1 urate hydroxylase PuuD [Modicisalibacter sp. R2A 31.J]MBZ9575374.1 urate hydroxylase PuuD [Modicisalibacter sp. MOD 31.J]
MEAYLLDFGNMLLRWLHVIAAIAWIGESIYFVMLDNGLRTPKAAEDRDKGVFGEMWAVHGGGFYHNQKYASAPAKLPEDLHWSFWKAYTTWLSGFGLFLLLYMSKPDFYLINHSSDWAWAANLAGWQANLVALAFLLGGWVVYNELCKRISPNMTRDGILSLAVAVMMIVVAYLSTHIFSGRAAFLLTGAVMATAMSANVFFWIIPGQRRMVKAMKAGETPDPLDGKRGKQRSVHNTYFTLPVVFLMLSNHYSFTYSHPNAWVIMVLFIFAGALIRQFFVLMHSGQIKPAYPVAGAALILLAVWVAMPVSSMPSADGEGVASAEDSRDTASATPQASDDVAAGGQAQGGGFAHVEGIIDQRCTVCHSQNPTNAAFTAPPAGVAFDDAAQIKRQMEQIQQVVASGYMPLGNLTEMTDQERQAIAAWGQ